MHEEGRVLHELMTFHQAPPPKGFTPSTSPNWGPGFQHMNLWRTNHNQTIVGVLKKCQVAIWLLGPKPGVGHLSEGRWSPLLSYSPEVGLPFRLLGTGEYTLAATHQPVLVHLDEVRASSVGKGREWRTKRGRKGDGVGKDGWDTGII
jgi:hypothetical protein